MGNEDKDSGSHVVSETIVEKRLDYDTESQTGAVPPEGTLKRQLKNRHIAMISIGGMCTLLPVTRQPANTRYPRCHRYRSVSWDR